MKLNFDSRSRQEHGAYSYLKGQVSTPNEDLEPKGILFYWI